jgi:putative DNA primase/helicase
MTVDPRHEKSESSLHSITLHQLANLLGGEVAGDEVHAPGPGHSFHDRSMSVKLDPDAPDGFIVHSFAGDDPIKCRDYIRQKIGVDPWKPKGKSNGSSARQQQSSQQNQQQGSSHSHQNRQQSSSSQQRGQQINYEYRLQDGTPYLLVIRKVKIIKGKKTKCFPQMHWDATLLKNGKPKGWVIGAPKGPKIPYRLPELVAHDNTQLVFVCEGEKDVETLASHGFTATTNSEGAGNWTADLDKYFAGLMTVYILTDNDQPGALHAANVAEHLKSVVTEVKIIDLPGLKEHQDVTDWIEAGNDPATLIELCRSHKGEAAKVAPEFTEEALALTFAERHTKKLRYVAAWGRWMIYDGKVWRHDNVLKSFTYAREICREAANRCGDERTETRLASNKTVAAVVQLARADERLAATVDQWDADIWLLNTPDGAVDLQTGTMRPHCIEDYVTKMTAVAPAPAGTPHPIFKEFSIRVTNKDACWGYVLTGSTREQTLEFFHGEANGKSVLLGTVSRIMGDYSTTAPIEVFTVSTFDRHPTELAGLRGARLVTAFETEEGRVWAESKLKALTGGDKIAARFMRQDFFEYTPQFKLMIAGNQKPALRTVDEAIRRRFHLVPFRVVIPIAERDHQLSHKLMAEWPAILRAMIDGCLEWQKDGLNPPTSVTEATIEYLHEENSMAAWVDECCVKDANYFESAPQLWASWKGWAESTGEYVGKRKDFRRKLAGQACIETRIGNVRGYKGLKVIMPKAAKSFQERGEDDDDEATKGEDDAEKRRTAEAQTKF